jgi:hypothetical protein
MNYKNFGGTLEVVVLAAGLLLVACAVDVLMHPRHRGCGCAESCPHCQRNCKPRCTCPLETAEHGRSKTEPRMDTDKHGY